MVGWHHQLNGHESEQAPRDGEGVLQPIRSQRRGHDSANEQQQAEKKVVVC